MTFKKGHNPKTGEKTGANTEPQKDNVVILNENFTPEERAISSRVSAASDDWKTITEADMEDFSLSEDPFKLPPPAVKLRKSKEFAFRWVTRSPERVDEIKNMRDPLRWWIVNSTQPVANVFMPFIDRTTGGVHKLDQILVFKPYWMFERELGVKRMLADGANFDITKKDGEEADGAEGFAASRRKMGEKPKREEVKGSDIHFTGEDDVDRAAGIYTPNVTDSDLVVNE